MSLGSHWTSGAFSFLGPAGCSFAPTGSRGSRGLAIRDSLRGPRNDVRGRHIFSGSWLRREGAYGFWGCGRYSAAPPQERQEGFWSGKFERRGRSGGGRVGRARRWFPQGRAGCGASPGRPGPGVGPGAAVRGCAPGSPRLPVPLRRGLQAPSRREHAPLPRRRECPGAPPEPCAWRRPPAGRPGAERAPGAPLRLGAGQGAGALPCGRGGEPAGGPGRGPGSRSPRGRRAARASHRLLGCGGHGGSARGCVLGSRRDASSWSR